MASIRKRGSSYLLVVSMGYDYEGNRIRPKQKTVHPPEGLTPKQREKWLKEQAVLFERECRSLPQEEVDRSITLAKYTELWLQSIAPGKLAKSTLARDRQDIDRFLPILGHYKLTELRPEHFRNFYADLRKVISLETGRPLSEHTVEGVHATLCTILSDAMEGGFLDHNPAWKMRLQMSESYATWQNLFELICDCVLKELINECFLIFGVSKTLTMCLT